MTIASTLASTLLRIHRSSCLSNRTCAIAIVGMLVVGCGDHRGTADPRLDLVFASATYSVDLVAQSEPDTPLTLVSDIAIDSAGRIFVADALVPQIVVFDGGARLLERYELRGEGPGEFRRIGNLGILPGNILWVFDPELTRLTLFDPDDLGYRESVMLFDTQSRGPSEVQRMTGDTLLLRYSSPALTDYEESRSAMRRDQYLTMDLRDPNRREEVLSVRAQSTFVVREGTGGTAVVDLFGPKSIVRAGRDGQIHAVWTDTFAVRSHDATGSDRVAWAYEIEPDAAADDEISAVLEMVGGDAGGAFASSSILDSLHRSSRQLPVVTGFVVDGDGDFWMGVRAAGGKKGRWLHLTPDGEILGSVDLPASEEIVEVLDDRIITLPRVPPWEVPILRIYRWSR